MMHKSSFESGADMLLVLPCCAIGACAGVTGLRRKPRCLLLPFQCLPMNTGDIIGLESVDIPYWLRKTEKDCRRSTLRSTTPAVWGKKSAFRLNLILTRLNLHYAEETTGPKKVAGSYHFYMKGCFRV